MLTTVETVKINYWEKDQGERSHISVLIPAFSGNAKNPARPERYISFYQSTKSCSHPEMDQTPSKDLTVISSSNDVMTKIGEMDKKRLTRQLSATFRAPDFTYELKTLDVLSMHKAFERIFSVSQNDDQVKTNGRHFKWGHSGNCCAGGCCESFCGSNTHNTSSICYEILKAGGIWNPEQSRLSRPWRASLWYTRGAGGFFILVGIALIVIAYTAVNPDVYIVRNPDNSFSHVSSSYYYTLLNIRNSLIASGASMAPLGAILFLLSASACFVRWGATFDSGMLTHVVRKAGLIEIIKEAVQQESSTVSLVVDDGRHSLEAQDRSAQSMSLLKSNTGSQQKTRSAGSVRSPSHATDDSLAQISVEKPQGFQVIPYKDLLFSEGEPLGEGGFGVVRKALWSFIEVAVKELKATRLSENALAEFRSEAERHAALRHPNIVILYGACLEAMKYCMVMELMVGGSLYDVLHNGKPLPWLLRLSIAKDIAIGLNYLHQQGILHRDMKSLNVLLDDRMRAKLSDFGLSKIKTESTVATSVKIVGSVRWMAPELFQRKAQCTESSDIYAMGMVFWELASRMLPFNESREDGVVIGWIKEGERDEIPKDTPPSFGKLISACWAQRTEDRPPTVGAVASTLATIGMEGSATAVANLESNYMVFSR